VVQSVKKELAAAAPAMSKLLSPAIEKSVQEALVKGDGNKDLSQVSAQTISHKPTLLSASFHIMAGAKRESLNQEPNQEKNIGRGKRWTLEN
jgi:hypothetical protein